MKMTENYSYRDADLYFHYSLDPKPDKRNYEMHTHEFCELYIFLSGKGNFKIEGNQYPLSPGDVLILKSNESHFIDIDESCPYERIAIHFRKELLLPMDPTGELTNAVLNHRSGHDNLFRATDFSQDLHKAVLRDLRQKSDHTRAKIVSHLMMLLYEICRQNSDARTEEIFRTEDSLPHRIVEYIMRHIEEPLTLDGICQEFYISKSKLCRTFRESTGSTVQNYITTKKISHAKWLMSTGIHPTVAASMCGFSDYSNFYRSFTKHCGTSPLTEFKQMKKSAPSVPGGEH